MNYFNQNKPTNNSIPGRLKVDFFIQGMKEKRKKKTWDV